MNPGVYSLGISEDPPRYLSSKFDASVRSDCWDVSIWKTLTQCDGNGNANTNANADNRGDYNSSPCTSYRRAKKWHLTACKSEVSLLFLNWINWNDFLSCIWINVVNSLKVSHQGDSTEYQQPKSVDNLEKYLNNLLTPPPPPPHHHSHTHTQTHT